MSNIAREWLSCFGGEDAAEKLMAALHFSGRDEDCAVYLWLAHRGGCVAEITREERVAGDAPRLRWAMTDERGTCAIVLPVMGTGLCSMLYEMRSDPGMVDVISDTASDLVGIPLDGSRARSFTGSSAALGVFDADAKGCARIFGTGRGWLDHQLARVRKASTEMPPHIAARETAPDGTLVLAPGAFDWSGVIAPHKPYPLAPDAKTLAIVDSRPLAEALDAAMRASARRYPRPQLFAPREGEAARDVCG